MTDFNLPIPVSCSNGTNYLITSGFFRTKTRCGGSVITARLNSSVLLRSRASKYMYAKFASASGFARVEYIYIYILFTCPSLFYAHHYFCVRHRHRYSMMRHEREGGGVSRVLVNKRKAHTSRGRCRLRRPRFTECNGRLGQRKRLNGLTRVEILLYLTYSARGSLRERDAS